MSSFDKSYDHYKKRNAIHTRVVALKITFLLVFLFIFSMALVVAGQDILELVLDYFHIQNTFTNILFNLIRYSTIILLFFFSISLIYYYGPATKKNTGLSQPEPQWPPFSPFWHPSASLSM
jgi:membrane protein